MLRICLAIMIAAFCLNSFAYADEAPTTSNDAAVSAPATTDSAKRPKVALALGGGGTRGLAHIGVLRVFKKEGIPIDFIAGTSMGAIVGGMYAAGVPLDDIQNMFLDNKLPKAYYTVPLWLRCSLVPFFAIPHLFGHHPYDGLYKGNKFAKFVTNYVPEDKRDLEKLDIPFNAIALNLLDGKPHAIKKGDIGRALQASSAIPEIRRPVPWQDGLFVDGGVIKNLPVSEAKDMGADLVVAVNVDEDLPVLPLDHFRKIGSVGRRCFNISLTGVDKMYERDADVIVHPDVTKITLLSRSKKDIRDAIASGEKAAQDAVPFIKAAMDKKAATMNSSAQSADLSTKAVVK